MDDIARAYMEETGTTPLKRAESALTAIRLGLVAGDVGDALETAENDQSHYESYIDEDDEDEQEAFELRQQAFERVGSALRATVDETQKVHPEDVEAMMVDHLTDLLHLTEALYLDFDILVEQATLHYEAEAFGPEDK